MIIGATSYLQSGYRICRFRTRGPYVSSFLLTFLLIFVSRGQLNSIIEHNLVSLFHITKSGLLCGILAAVFIEMFHQYSRECSLYINSGSPEPEPEREREREGERERERERESYLLIRTIFFLMGIQTVFATLSCLAGK